MEQKKIKIIYIIPTLDLGGAERVAIDLVKNLNKEKFEVKIICLKRLGIWGLELKRSGIEMILVSQKNKLGTVSLIKLIKILKNEKPDIVHTHLFGADIIGAVAARLANIKHIISTEHNLNLEEGKIKKIAKKYTAKLARVITTVSEAVKNYIVKSEGINLYKIKVIYNGVETAKFLNQSRIYQNREKIIIGSVGRLTQQKGFEHLINAVSKLENKKIECQIAGDGVLREKLEQQIKKLNLTTQIKLLGWQKNINDFLNSLDIFILPSLWEGFGIVILEAGLSGLPVIASAVDGIKEIIRKGENGLLAKPADAVDLAEKISYLANNPNERKRLGLNLQLKVKEKFDIKKIVKQYEELYLKLICV